MILPTLEYEIPPIMDFKYSLKPLREEHWPWMLNLMIALKISKKK